jgi:hypothetical protein
MYRAYVTRIVVFDSASSPLNELRAHSTAFVDLARPGECPLRNAETNILKGFFTKLKSLSSACQRL